MAAAYEMGGGSVTDQPIDRLREAVQTYLNETEDIPVLLDSCVVVWESMWFSEDHPQDALGPAREVSLCVPTDRASFATTMGLLVCAQDDLKRRVTDAQT